MNRLNRISISVLSAAFAVSMVPARAADELPKAETILEKYVEVTGGKAAYEKHHSEISKGTVEMAAMGIKGTITSYRAEPNKSYSEVELGPIGKMREGSDGTVFWSSSAMVGPHIKEGAEKTQSMLLERMNSEVKWRDVFKDVKTTGADTVDGKPCDVVVLTPKEGDPITECYDKQSGLLVRISLTAQSPMGEVKMEMFPSDYRKESDVIVPHLLKQSVAGQDITFNVESVTFNADIPAEKFALPDEIKALVNKK